MKSSAVVIPFLGQGLEVLDRLGRDLGPELDHQFAFGGGNDSDFVRVHFLRESAGTIFTL